MDLDGKVAIVTGASRGVGAATAVALAAAGARVACAARATDRRESAADPGDHRRDRARRSATRVATRDRGAHEPRRRRRSRAHGRRAPIDAYGRVDILVNNAAITFPGDLELPMKRHDLDLRGEHRAPLIGDQRGHPRHARARRGRDPQRVVARGAQLLPGADGVRDVEDRARAHDGLGRRTAATRPHPGEHVPHRRARRVGGLRRATRPALDHSRLGAERGRGRRASSGCCASRPEYTGHNVGMAALRDEHGIMASKVGRPARPMPGIVTANPMQLD